jgi:hypothetical protein
MYLSSDLLHCHANFSSRGKSTTAIAVDLRRVMPWQNVVHNSSGGASPYMEPGQSNKGS